MNAAVVHELGATPTYGAFEDPLPLPDEVGVAVTASALTHFTRVRAAGTHRSDATPPPFVPGIDGVGRLDDGTRVYFLFPRAPFGGMAERTVARRSALIALPDGLDDVTAAAIADPGMSAWAALQDRAGLREGETVLVNGATGIAGGLAVQIARHLGAGEVIATGRDARALDRLRASGVDRTIDLTDAAGRETALRAVVDRGVDVVVDYLWGPSAERILAAATDAGAHQPLRFVQVGISSAPTITLPGAPLHGAPVTITGSGVGAVAPASIAAVLHDLLRAAPEAGFRVPTRPWPLSAVAEAWRADPDRARVVLTTP